MRLFFICLSEPLRHPERSEGSSLSSCRPESRRCGTKDPFLVLRKGCLPSLDMTKDVILSDIVIQGPSVIPSVARDPFWLF